jgi:MFS superfamily sulfate permease-like transporter
MPDQVSMDMTRNEVQIDLDKFMAMSAEVSDLKDQLREATDPELQDKRNPWQKWIHLAKAVDAWRIWPRAFLSVYIFLIYFVVMWFIDLPAPTMEQSGLISILVGAGAAWFGLYVNSASKDHASDANGK